MHGFLCKPFHIFTFLYVYYFSICAFLCIFLLLLCTTLFVSGSVCLSFVQLFEKSYCDKTNLVVFAISVTIILFKQLQMIWDCITSFKMCQSSCQSLCLCLWKIWISHYGGVVLPMHHFWNFSR